MKQKPIEEEIKQLSFRSSRQKATLNLIVTYKLLKSHIQNSLKPHGLTIQQFNVLRILRGSRPQPLTTIEIRSRMLDKMSDTSRIVDRLSNKNLVSKCVNPQDRRLVQVNISQDGLKLLKSLDKQEEKFDQLLGTLEDGEVEMLNSLCEKIRLSIDTDNPS